MDRDKIYFGDNAKDELLSLTKIERISFSKENKDFVIITKERFNEILIKSKGFDLIDDLRNTIK